jgi:hypothetical protein
VQRQTKQERIYETSKGDRTRRAEKYPDRDRADRLPQKHSGNVGASGAQCHPDADLPHSRRDSEYEYAKHAEGRQEKRCSGEG